MTTTPAADQTTAEHSTSVNLDRTTGSYRWACSCGEGSLPVLPSHAADSLARNHMDSVTTQPTAPKPLDLDAIGLPPLDMPCPDCTTEEARRRIIADRNAWVNEEITAYEKFTAEYPNEWGAADAWQESEAYRELYNREPDPVDVGCVECDYTKVRLTDAGRTVLAFMRRWSK